jgi:hypothetical protein
MESSQGAEIFHNILFDAYLLVLEGSMIHQRSDRLRSLSS